jgi:UDP-N-acetylmuramoyl-tripeptide--D-alanyl-D-alanine ligase
MTFDMQTIAQITAGRILPEYARATVSGISTDSRTSQQGDLFVPLRGDKFDGHDFLLQAVRRGVGACLSEEVIAGFPVPVIRVENTLKALGDLAAAVRSRMSGPVVAVTGSSGKTTTKEMLAAILTLTGPGLKTEGNFNNLIGLPHTLFRLNATHRWAVLEMGMSARGEIARLAEIASPTIGVITNVGPAHLETLHGLDGVARAKGELFAALRSGATALINADDERVAQLPVANGVRRLLFGLTGTADFRAEDVVVGTGTVSFRLVLPQEKRVVVLQTPGRHNVLNALAAAAAATVLGVNAEHIVRGLESFRPSRGRMELISLPDGILLFEDSYNANPLSVKAALQTLDEAGGSGRRIAVLGDMLELGASSSELHAEVGQAAAGRVDFLVLLGDKARQTAAGATRGGMAADRITVVADHQAAVLCLRALIRPGDRVLVKGSRGMRMEQISAALREERSCLAAGNS